MTLHRDWPLFGLRIISPRLSLRYPSDEDLDALNQVVSQGIHDPAEMPFEIPWTDDPPDVRPRNSLQFWWGLRAGWKPSHWVLTMLVEERETIVGVQDLIGVEYARTRQVATGSWLGKAYQGHGIGKEMRAAVLHLAFAGLGAQRATSEAFEDNAASLAVSRALGYVENGDDIKVSRGRSRRAVRLVLHREVWQKNCRDDMQIQGLESCATMFGLDRMDS